MKSRVLLMIALVVVITSTAVAGLQSVTVASFADPSGDSFQSLFTSNYNDDIGQGTINGGWSGTGLTLLVPVANLVYTDVTFTMSELTFSGETVARGVTTAPTTSNPYVISFFSGITEVMTVTFDSLFIESRHSGLDAQDIYGDNVTITGIGIGKLTNEHFGFTFVNITSGSETFDATASFTSSATIDTSPTPEPATMAIFALGALMLRKRRA